MDLAAAELGFFVLGVGACAGRKDVAPKLIDFEVVVAATRVELDDAVALIDHWSADSSVKNLGGTEHRFFGVTAAACIDFGFGSRRCVGTDSEK